MSDQPHRIVCHRQSGVKCPLCMTDLAYSGGGKTYRGIAFCGKCSLDIANGAIDKAWLERQLDRDLGKIASRIHQDEYI